MKAKTEPPAREESMHQWLAKLMGRPSRGDQKRRLLLEQLEARDVPSVTFQFDYSLDTNNFFNTQAKKDLLVLAGQLITARLQDSLAAITPSGGNNWNAQTTNPATGNNISLGNIAVPADTIIVYAGGRNLALGEVGEGGGYGYTANGDQTFLDTVAARGQAGALLPAAQQTDYGPPISQVCFDTFGTNWFFGTTTTGISASQTDFMSVAEHELGHVLGLGVADSWFHLVSGNNFVGAAAEAVNGGPVPLSSTLDHWNQNDLSDGQAPTMVPVLQDGQRHFFTDLDYAGLQDVGWQVGPAQDISISASSVAEESPVGTAVGTLSTNDPNPANQYVFSLVTGSGSSDNASFTINGSSLLTNTLFDFEAKSTYNIRVRATAPDNTFFEKALTISITDVTGPPTNLTLSNDSVADTSPAGTTVGTFTTTDPDADDTTFVYTLVSGTGSNDNASFAIAGNALQTAATLSPSRPYSVRVRTTNEGGFFYETTFTINVTQTGSTPSAVNDEYVLSSASAASVASSSVLANDSGGTSASTTVSTSLGVLTFRSNGTFTYTPGAGFWGLDTFAYTASNGVQTSQSATVSLETHSAALVRKLYNQVLHRDPDQGGWQFWTHQVDAGATTLGNIATGFFESPERLDPIIAQMYHDYLLRVADAAGLAFWRGIWQHDGGPENVIAGIVGSPEFFQSAAGTNAAWVSAVYSRLLNRPADPAGEAFWTSLLDNHTLTLAGVVLGFVGSQENFQNLVVGWYQEYLGRAPNSTEEAIDVNQLLQGVTQRAIQIQILNLPEYFNEPPLAPAGTAQRVS
jgi:hypothetical protein